jgi:small subunit ribosomal protein S2
MTEENNVTSAASAPSAAAEPGFLPTEELNPVSLRKLIDAGVHFGHQTNRWNPRMAPFIYGARNGIHIIDLDQTVRLFKRSLDFVANMVAKGGQVLFVGTKRQAQETIIEEATRSGQFHVTGRWLGGTLTNFRTMKVGIDRLRSLQEMAADGTFETMTKKEALLLTRESERLQKFVGGIRDMSGLPGALFVIDPNHEHIAVSEANKLNIPVIALTDTNCDPDKINFLIPGNDDAIRSIKLVSAAIADACVAGQARRRDYMQSGRRDDAGGGGSSGPQVEFARASRSARTENRPEAADAPADAEPTTDA